MPQPIVLIGGGGHCASCIEVIESIGKWKIVGIIDTPQHFGESILGYRVIGSDNDLAVFAIRHTSATITVGQIETADVRQRLYTAARNAGFELPVIIASTARVSHYATIGNGTMIFHQAFINARASIGEDCIINTGAIVEHDATIGAHCHISTGAIINGGCKIGNGCFIGSAAVLRNGVVLQDGIILGAGSVVVHDLVDAGIYAGCPARKLVLRNINNSQ